MTQCLHGEGRTRPAAESTRSEKSRGQSHGSESATSPRTDRKGKLRAPQQFCVFPSSDGKRKPSLSEDSLGANSSPQLRGALLPQVPRSALAAAGGRASTGSSHGSGPPHQDQPSLSVLAQYMLLRP